jgi:hypothetical protein
MNRTDGVLLVRGVPDAERLERVGQEQAEADGREVQQPLADEGAYVSAGRPVRGRWGTHSGSSRRIMVSTVGMWDSTGTQHLYPASPSRGGLAGPAGVTTRPARYPSGGVPPAVERQLHLHHTPSQVPQRWGTTSCRETAPLTPHAQPGTPAVGYRQLSRGSSTYTTHPAGYPSGGVPPAVERPLH